MVNGPEMILSEPTVLSDEEEESGSLDLSQQMMMFLPLHMRQYMQHKRMTPRMMRTVMVTGVMVSDMRVL